jgi:hypothetical protein
MTAEPVHRTILVLDIVGFAHPKRTDPGRLRLREELYELLHQLLVVAGIDPGHVPCVDLGDGVIVLLDPQLAATRVVEVVTGRLAVSLAERNRRSPGDERLRLRLALHRGEVLIDPHGFVGGALVEASRLSNATALRDQLDVTAADLVLIVSDQMWRQLTGPDHEPLGPGGFHPVSTSTHGVTTRAWIHVPDHPTGPGTAARPGLATAPVYRSILAVDIQSSTAVTRTDPVKERLRIELYRLLDQALSGAGITERQHDPTCDRGDGFLLLLHPVDHVPKTLLLGSLLPGLSAGLAAYNREAPEAERLLLRVALHAGEVHHDANGPFGGPIDVTIRLLEAPAFKAYRYRSDEPLVLVVSGDIYRSVVWHEYPGIDRSAYRQLFRVRVAGRYHQGWVRIF